MLAHLGLEVFRREELLAQVAGEDAAVADQQHRPRFEEAAHRLPAHGRPVHRHVPGDERADQDAAFRHRCVGARQRVLRGVGDDDDEQDVGDAHAAAVAPQREAEDEEEEPVHQRAAGHQFERRRVDGEQGFHGADAAMHVPAGEAGGVAPPCQEGASGRVRFREFRR